jgi:pyruvate,water dikinase
VQKALELIAAAARRHDRQLSICGDGPSRHPDMIERLVALGFTAISVSPEAFANTVKLVAEAEARLGISSSASA